MSLLPQAETFTKVLLGWVGQCSHAVFPLDKSKYWKGAAPVLCCVGMNFRVASAQGASPVAYTFCQKCCHSPDTDGFSGGKEISCTVVTSEVAVQMRTWRQKGAAWNGRSMPC